MPVGATIGAAAIGGAAQIGGGIMGAGATRDAAQDAARSSAATNASNSRLSRENRDFAYGVLQPYSNSGLQAQGVLNGMLYGTPQPNALPAASGGYQPPRYAGPSLAEIQAMQNDGIEGNSQAAMLEYNSWNHSPQPNALGGTDWNAYLNDPLNSDARADYDANHAGTDPAAYAQRHYAADGSRRSLAPYTPTQSALAPAGTVNSQSPWDQFRNSTNYKFRYDEGMNALNLGLANNGYAGSGMAMKEAVKYGQNFASNELNNYIGLLTGQQQIGMGAASAMVGVGQNTTNALIAGNTQNGANQANAGLVGAQAQSQMWGNVAQGVGQIAGAVGSSYGVQRGGNNGFGSFGTGSAPNGGYGGVGGNLFG